MCSESGAYGGHDEYMMSHDDYEPDMDDYYHDHDMGDFDHDYDASCMEDMADHRYDEHDMVDHHHYYDHHRNHHPVPCVQLGTMGSGSENWSVRGSRKIPAHQR